MARKSKYNPQLAEKIVQFIRLGYTLKDTSLEVRISDETIRRWRNNHPDFNDAIVKASNSQWEYSRRELKRQNSGLRIYRRQKESTSKYYSLSNEKPVLEPLMPSQRQYVCGLPIRPCAPDKWEATPMYYNQSSGMVEWIDRYPLTGRLTFHRCPLNIYEEKMEKEALQKIFPF